MPKSYLSLNINADGCVEQDINRAGQFLFNCGAEFYNITTAARFNESEKLIRLLRTLAPKARPIWRGWPSMALEDGGIWQRVTPQEWINYRIKPNVRWLNNLDGLGVLVLPCSEVGVLGADARRYSNWEADCIKLASLYDVELAVLRLSTGNPLETEHENYDAVLQAASEFDAVLSFNEYAARDGRLSTNHHIGRYRWAWKRQDELKIKRSQVVIGEYALCQFNADNKPDPYKGCVNIDISEQIADIKRDGAIYQADGTTACWFTFGNWQQGAGSFSLQTHEELLKTVEIEAEAGRLDTKRITQTVPVVPPAPPPVVTPPPPVSPVTPAPAPTLPPITTIDARPTQIKLWSAYAKSLRDEAAAKIKTAEMIESLISLLPISDNQGVLTP